VALWRQGLDDLNRDHLTGLYNQRGLEQQIEVFKASQQGRSQAEPATLVCLDLDRFKMLNDGLGRAAGDSALRHVATVLQKQLHDRALVARSRDDEFVVWLPGTPLAKGMEVAERMRRAVEMEFWGWNGMRFPITASCGVAAYPESVGDIYNLQQTVDAALFRAKQMGRNRVVSGLL
jgi:diguanylate cyclase